MPMLLPPTRSHLRPEPSTCPPHPKLRVVKAVLTLGEALGLHVVAEGVEHADQLALLGDLGGVSAQGYLLARPMTGDALATWLSAQENLVRAR